jgi:hypothetical protein
MEHSDAIIRHLVNVVRCLQCQARYEPGDIQVVGHQDQLWFLIVTCPGCATRGLVAALVREAQDPASAPASERDGDLIGSEVTRRVAASTGRPVSDGDVAEMREFLAGFDGDIDAMLAAR